MKKVLILDYQENFADNLSCFAYGKILEKKFNRKCCYENSTKKRSVFEDKMQYFDINCDYISSSRVSEIVKNAYVLNFKTHKNRLKNSNYDIINLPIFKLEDMEFIDDNIINSLKFKDLDFVLNFDILDEIKSKNSIGLYVSVDDIKNLDYDYIFNSTKRLNKYLKSPYLYVFSQDKNLKINSYVDWKVISLDNKMEEFYFLQSCKHKIILNSKNSYSTTFWASILNDRFYSLKTYKKDKKSKFTKHNWLAI